MPDDPVQLAQQIFANLPTEPAQIIQTIVTGVLVWMWWSMKRVFVTREKLEAELQAIDHRFDALEQTFTALQAGLRHLPDKDSLHAFEVNVSGKLGSVEHAVVRLEKMLDAINTATIAEALK